MYIPPDKRTMTSPSPTREIYNVITSNYFEEFYQGKLSEHIRGDEDCASREEILNDIKRMFNDAL